MSAFGQAGVGGCQQPVGAAGSSPKQGPMDPYGNQVRSLLSGSQPAAASSQARQAGQPPDFSNWRANNLQRQREFQGREREAWRNQWEQSPQGQKLKTANPALFERQRSNLSGRVQV
jgi:hypothetical protein